MQNAHESTSETCLDGRMEGYIIGDEYSTEQGSLRREEEISEIRMEIYAAHGQKS